MEGAHLQPKAQKEDIKEGRAEWQRMEREDFSTKGAARVVCDMCRCEVSLTGKAQTGREAGGYICEKIKGM